ncbi:MAG: Rieske 2Fe-2S domain-containing protein [Myxococcales bacterium]|nr:Rieske 2Fe-2S domain-containing protein [Myxococcales bacterium]
MSEDVPGGAPPSDGGGAPPPSDGDGTRRRFLQFATCAVGGGLGAAVLIPAARLIAHPIGRAVVSSATTPIDAIAVDQVGAEPVRVPLVAATVRDAYASTANVVLGAAFLRRGADGTIRALSSVCPHKGCTIGFAAATHRFECPCHSATFDLDGNRLSGPAERGLDPLPVTVERGRVKVTWVRFRAGGRDRTKA